MRNSALLALLPLILAPLFGQEFKGTISGRITDPSGAVVPAAKITITNQETNVAIEVGTNAEGNYFAPFLLPGTYKAAVAAPGFRQILRENAIIQVNDRISLDFALQLGGTGEVITVSAESPMLQTASADLGQVADRKFLDDAVLMSTVMNLANMGPACSPAGLSASPAPWATTRMIRTDRRRKHARRRAR